MLISFFNIIILTKLNKICNHNHILLNYKNELMMITVAVLYESSNKAFSPKYIPAHNSLLKEPYFIDNYSFCTVSISVEGSR